MLYHEFYAPKKIMLIYGMQHMHIVSTRGATMVGTEWKVFEIWTLKITFPAFKSIFFIYIEVSE